MLKVTVELWPKGKEWGKKILGTAVIVNDGTGDDFVGNYNAVVSGADNYPVWVRVENFNRAVCTAWELLSRVLDEYVRAEVVDNA
jgi:hypothetical protein